jgi:hypothetical protein
MITVHIPKLSNPNTFSQVYDYYLDNYHWAESDIKPSNTFKQWFSKEYSADVDYLSQVIYFHDEKKYTHFALRWL